MAELCRKNARPPVGCVIMASGLARRFGFNKLLADFAEHQPHLVTTVPRLFEVLHASYQRRLAAAQRAQPAAPLETLRAAALAEARHAFGKNLLAVSIGSAPVSAEVLAFLKTYFSNL